MSLPKGLELWDDDSLQIKIIETTKPFTALEISSSGSLENWTFLLTVDASVKTRFLSGLIDFEKFTNNNNNERQNKRTNKHILLKEVKMNLINHVESPLQLKSCQWFTLKSLNKVIK